MRISASRRRTTQRKQLSNALARMLMPQFAPASAFSQSLGPQPTLAKRVALPHRKAIAWEADLAGIDCVVSSSDADVAYVYLPSHPGRDSDGAKGVVKRQVRLFDLIGAYSGPDLFFDFDKDDTLIGVEILA